jgi:serine/threonine protein kinase
MNDVSQDNVLLDDKLNPRLTDFGLSRMMATSTLWATSTKSIGGTLRWMAPELVNQDDAKPTAASDVYAFGMTCYVRSNLSTEKLVSRGMN